MMTSFADLDRKDGKSELAPVPPEGEYSLPAWYRAVHETPIESLTHFDLRRALCQQIHVDYVLPIVISILNADPLAGDLYDGDLLDSLNQLPTQYWVYQKNNRNAVAKIVSVILADKNGDAEVRSFASKLSDRLGRDA